MKERPIIMTGESVRAILAGTKTQTRRVAKPEEFGMTTFDELIDDLGKLWTRFSRKRHPRYGEVGDLLWVRETWDYFGGDEYLYQRDPSQVIYLERDELRQDIGTRKWRSPLYMPRWTSRLSLRVTDVRVQRLHAISDADARAEGVEPYTPPNGHISPEQRVPGPSFDGCRLGDHPYRLPFAHRWDEINGKRVPWASNPWVWALTFEALAPAPTPGEPERP